MSERDGAETGADESADDETAIGSVDQDSGAGSGSTDSDAGGSEPESAGAERIQDIAAEPAGDVDRALRHIAADAVDLPWNEAEVPIDEMGEPAFEPADLEVDEELVERVASADPEAVAVEIATLQLRVAALEGETEELQHEVDDLESRLARKQADFQNYKQRQQRRLEQEKARATEALVERLLDVRDNLQRALDQDDDADIRGGVESTLRQFDQELEREEVGRIEPAPGDETDPQRHEVLMRVASDQPEDAVADVHRPGYEMGGKVLRPAQVTVSEGPADPDETGDANGAATDSGEESEDAARADEEGVGEGDEG